VHDQLVGLTYMLIGVTLYASQAIVAKIALRQDVDPLTLVAVRFAFGLALHWTYAVLCRRVVRLPSGLLLRVGLLGALGSGVASTLSVLALARIPASHVALLFATYPSWVTVGDRILNGVPITRPRILGLAAALVGAAFLTLGENVQALGMRVNLGSILALANAICYAIFFVLSRRHVTRLSAGVVAPYYTTFAFLTLLLLRPPWQLVHADLQPELWGPALYMAAVGGFVGFFAFLKALQYFHSGEAALIGTLEPAMSVVLAYLILGEHLFGWQLAGLVLILLGVLVGQLEQLWTAVNAPARRGGGSGGEGRSGRRR